MEKENQTSVDEFIFLGLSEGVQTQILLFIFFLIVYLLTILGNLLIIILIFVDSQLHTPMYFFLRNLSFADLCFSTSIVPQMLIHFLVKKKTISFWGCMTQIIVFLLVGCTECALLAVMSYDRYVAVCKPLHYSTIMTQQLCLQLAIGSWASGALVSLVDTTFTFHLPYRGDNKINHYFCEPPVLLKLASADTYNTEMAIFAMGVVILLAPVSLILVSYWNIISTVIHMQSGEGKFKAFSTCSSHLIVVVLFYGSGIFTYMRPNSKTTKERDKMISVFYTVVTPMLNPIIYSLRNKDVKGALRKLARRNFCSRVRIGCLRAALWLRAERARPSRALASLSGPGSLDRSEAGRPVSSGSRPPGERNWEWRLGSSTRGGRWCSAAWGESRPPAARARAASGGSRGRCARGASGGSRGRCARGAIWALTPASQRSEARETGPGGGRGPAPLGSERLGIRPTAIRPESRAISRGVARPRSPRWAGLGRAGLDALEHLG
ncbi:olfactory receptor 2D3-like [Dipodomys merriami]|uniref:olfactory receptor 2D3-like n=1 Tax=Dipodomys merriami TaxID=94247 RepID=UPI003855B2A8